MVTRTKTYIYGLVDPRTDQIRYVGKADRPMERLRHHFAEARKGNRDRKSRWIASLLRLDMRPRLTIIEYCAVDVWEERERFWISHYNLLHPNMVNADDGGRAAKPSIESRRKMSESAKRRGANNKCVKHSDESKMNFRSAALRRYSAMTREERQQSAAHLSPFRGTTKPGWHHTAEAREKISRNNGRRRASHG
jgi:hypothetical protein